MKNNINLFSLFLVLAVLFSSCSQRLIDFTVISSKSHALGIDKSQGKKVEGKSMKFLGIGANIKDAMDEALSSAGPKYDLLVDGIVRIKQYPFYAGYIVEGIAIDSKAIKTGMTEKEYEQWCKVNNVFNPETAVIETGK